MRIVADPNKAGNYDVIVDPSYELKGDSPVRKENPLRTRVLDSPAAEPGAEWLATWLQIRRFA